MNIGSWAVSVKKCLNISVSKKIIILIYWSVSNMDTLMNNFKVLIVAYFSAI